MSDSVLSVIESRTEYLLPQMHKSLLHSAQLYTYYPQHRKTALARNEKYQICPTHSLDQRICQTRKKGSLPDSNLLDSRTRYLAIKTKSRHNRPPIFHTYCCTMPENPPQSRYIIFSLHTRRRFKYRYQRLC